MPDHGYFANLIWQIADLLRGPYRPPQYERVMLPMTVFAPLRLRARKGKQRGVKQQLVQAQLRGVSTNDQWHLD